MDVSIDMRVSHLFSILSFNSMGTLELLYGRLSETKADEKCEYNV